MKAEDAFTERWLPAQFTKTEAVAVGGAGAYVEIHHPHRIPRDRIERFDIYRVEITWRWSADDLNASDSEAPHEMVKMLTARHGRPNGGYLFLTDRNLHHTDWVLDLVQRSMPRL